MSDTVTCFVLIDLACDVYRYALGAIVLDDNALNDSHTNKSDFVKASELARARDFGHDLTVEV